MALPFRAIKIFQNDIGLTILSIQFYLRCKEIHTYYLGNFYDWWEFLKSVNAQMFVHYFFNIQIQKSHEKSKTHFAFYVLACLGLSFLSDEIPLFREAFSGCLISAGFSAQTCKTLTKHAVFKVLPPFT